MDRLNKPAVVNAVLIHPIEKLGASPPVCFARIAVSDLSREEFDKPVDGFGTRRGDGLRYNDRLSRFRKVFRVFGKITRASLMYG